MNKPDFPANEHAACRRNRRSLSRPDVVIQPRSPGGYEIGFSDGIVSTRPNGETRIDDLMARADALMYQHKTRLAPPDDAAGEG